MMQVAASSRHKLLTKITHDFSINLFKLPASPHTKLGSGRAGGHGAADAGRNKQVHLNAEGALRWRAAYEKAGRKKPEVVAASGGVRLLSSSIDFCARSRG